MPSPAGPELPGPGVAWYRRRPFLLVGAAVIVVGVSVVTDLPTHTSRASDIQAETAVIAEINADVGPCVFSVSEALVLYGDETSGTLSPGSRGQIPALLRDDQNACAFTNSSIYDLSNIEVPGTAAGKLVSQAVDTTTLWTTSDALGAIEAVQALTSNPSDEKAKAQLAEDKLLLDEDAAKVASEIDAAGRKLGTVLPALKLSTTSNSDLSPAP